MSNSCNLGGEKASEEDLGDDLGRPGDTTWSETSRSGSGAVMPHDVPAVVTSAGDVFQSDARKSSDASFQLHNT